MTTLTILSSHPDFSQISSSGKESYEYFFESTNNANISNYARGANLEKLASQAHSLRTIIHIARLSIPADSTIQDQWQLNRLSEVKQRLARAIEMKRDYYDSHPFGIITKYVLMCFGMWNKGDTAAIIAAEDFLLIWDSRQPLCKISNPDNSSFGKYSRRQDFQIDSLNATQYFNYNPRRQIELDNGSKINYSNLRA